MLVREISIGNWNEINEIYINNINILSLLTNWRSRALRLSSLCASYTEYFQNKQLGIIELTDIENPKSAQYENFLST